jgi:hypothetical protein
MFVPQSAWYPFEFFLGSWLNLRLLVSLSPLRLRSIDARSWVFEHVLMISCVSSRVSSDSCRAERVHIGPKGRFLGEYNQSLAWGTSPAIWAWISCLITLTKSSRGCKYFKDYFKLVSRSNPNFSFRALCDSYAPFTWMPFDLPNH